MLCRAIPYKGNEPYIFVSYCLADKELVYPLIEQLSLDGYRSWYDDGNRTDPDWLSNIEAHLENCRVMIAFISKNFNDFNNCNKEIISAMKCGKKIIPVLLENVALPKGFRMQLEYLHCLDKNSFASAEALLRKCYETEECKACKAPSGIPLGSVQAEQQPKAARKNPLGNLMDHLTPVSLNRGSKAKKADAPESPKEVSPDTHQEENKHVAVHIPAAEEKHTPCMEDPSEKTVVPDFDPATEATVYCDYPEDGTVIDRGNQDSDEDKTVRISRNLAILLHPSEQKAYKLKSPKITIGRSPIRCDVVINDNDSISKVHAFIYQTKQKCYLEDANSSNGTYVNGEPIEPGQQISLDNPAVFRLNDETMILLSGLLARKFDKTRSVSLLMNSEGTSVRIMESDSLPLNRNNKWPDGTMSDLGIHRAAHALVCRRDDGVYLVDESPNNKTYLNGKPMAHGDSKLLASGDRIRLGNTTLEYISIEIPS